MAKIGIRLLVLTFAWCILCIISFSFIGQILNSPVLSFISNAQGNRDIFLLDVRTRQLHNLTDTPALDEWTYVWSQDGSHLIYSVPTDAGDDLFVMDASGRHRQRINGLDTLQAFNLTWSPDGQSLAYFSSYQNSSDLYLISLVDKAVYNLTDTPGTSESFPEWSPQGTHLLFFILGDMYLFNLETGNIKRLTETATTESYPRWSPDGTQIVFHHSQGLNSPGQLRHMDMLSGKVRALTLPIAPRAEPISWSPDNQHFTITLDTQQVIIYDLVSNTVQALTDGSQRTSSAVWSPDGTTIAYIENRQIQVRQLHHTAAISFDLNMSVPPPIVWQP